MKLNIQLFAYTKKEWKDLPSKDTPIFAADLNNIENQLQTNTNDINALNTKLNNIEDGIETNNKKLSGEEVIGNIVVDSIRTKNMFDKNSVAGGGFLNNGSIVVNSTLCYTPNYIEVKPSTTYTFSSSSSSERLVICEYNSSKTFIKRNIAGNTNTYTITTSSTTTYVRLNSVLANLDNLQFEEGSSRTTYSAYQNLDKTLDNYSTSEQRIGTWIDGKPIYRKVFTIEIADQTNISMTHNITNMDNIWINSAASFIFSKSNSESLPTNWYYTSGDWCRTWVNSTHIKFRTSVSLGNRTLYAILEYTKTTD